MYKEVLKAKNYVGVIQTSHGTVIEILPKICKTGITHEETRKIFLKMLSTLKDSPFKNLGKADLKSYNFHLFEIFITMFLDETIALLKKGLKSDYVSVEENSSFLKGKLRVERNVFLNTVHKERFYIEYDEFCNNRPENRLIKTTVRFLSSISNNMKNQDKIRNILFMMDDIEESRSIEKDFLLCKSDRFMFEYEDIMKWCRIFLNKESFSNFKGNTIAFAILFPMEKIFESFATHLIKKENYLSKLKVQNSGSYLCKHDNRNMFKIIPDITGEKDNKVYIIDAKWKLLINDSSKNFGISQNDFYQVFSYAKIYEKEFQSCEVILLYPKSNDELNSLYFYYNDKNNVMLNIVFIDIELLLKRNYDFKIFEKINKSYIE